MGSGLGLQLRKNSDSLQSEVKHSMYLKSNKINMKSLLKSKKSLCHGPGAALVATIS
jgi:hypothetical protein